MHSPDDHTYLRRAFAAARTARAAGDRPFGAVLVRDGQAAWTARNRQNTAGDPSAHAELVLLREACAAVGAGALRGATVYASGEPCAMCAGALFWAGVARIVYGAPTPEIEARLGGPRLGLRCADVLAGAQPPVAVEGPVLPDKALAALQSS
ncbi:nucleoside deaminase [Pseudorhodoferax sp.]|uniref:nucleoside deaminase n=1 Tax=Pseudorhodoferax sp. TaxID=1993553 RepID=UPI0039E59811